MTGDFSRDTFDALRDHAATLLQQGRPVTDADWNEMVRTLMRRVRAGTVDTIGRAVVPRETRDGFDVRVDATEGVRIGRGRMYLAGLLLECHGLAAFPGTSDGGLPRPVLDRARIETGRPVGVLDEPIAPPAGDGVPYARQPYWPRPDPLPASGRHLAYMVAWERDVSALHAPELLESALGGIDTTTRIQNVWQVRLVGADAGAGCATSDGALGIAGWHDEIAPSTARLSVDSVPVDVPEDPCLIPPTDGYTGLENQFYRVELHAVGAEQHDAHFKFSRENASVNAAVETIADGGMRIIVSRIGRDALLAFRAGDWVEITDDRREFDHRAGQLLRIAVVHAETREIEFEAAIDAGFIPAGGDDTLSGRHTRLIRWDQRGVIRRESGEVWVDLDAPGSHGAIPVPPVGTRLVLESGIVVAFDTAPGAGRYREMDYWRFHARSAGATVHRLDQAPPDGIHRHVARLAIVDLPSGPVSDCRVFWPPDAPATEAATGCACTVCVTPESHASGALTIQAAIDQLPPPGGTVCLAAGPYQLDEPVVIASRLAVTLRGQGASTMLTYQGAGGAIQIRDSVDVTVERLTVLARLQRDAVDDPTAVAGVLAIDTALLSLRRVAVIVLGGTDRTDVGIAFAGLGLGSTIDACLVLAPIAIGALIGRERGGARDTFVAAEFRVVDCVLIGARAAVRFDGPCSNLAAAHLSRNLLFGGDVAVHIAWHEIPGASTSIEGNSITAARGSGAVLACGSARVHDNEITAGHEPASGIALVPGIVPGAPADAHLVGNRIRDLGGAGVLVQAPMDTLVIQRNVIRHCGHFGIAIAADGGVRWAAVEHNVIEEIARTGSEGAGIAAVGVESGRIAWNRIAGVGAIDGGNLRVDGVAIRGTDSIHVESNRISDIGTAASDTPVTGIRIAGHYGAVTVRSNDVVGAIAHDEASGRSWAAIQIGRDVDRQFDREAIHRPMTSVPLYAWLDGDIVHLVVGDQRLSLSARMMHALTPARIESQVNVEGNQATHRAATVRPLLAVFDTDAGSCIFANNQCRQDGPADVPGIAAVQAGRIVAANNVVRRFHDDRHAMWLDTGREGRATVLGNLTFGGIDLLPHGLGPPFDALNLIAP